VQVKRNRTKKRPMTDKAGSYSIIYICKFKFYQFELRVAYPRTF